MSVRAAEASDARPRLKRRPGYVGAVHVGRLVLVEAVLLGIVATVPLGPIFAGVTAFVGILVILLVLLRSHGRWWIERRSMGRQYARRRRAGAGAEQTVDRRLTMLRTLAPGLAIQDVGPADGGQVGIGCDAAGWYAAAVLGSETSMRGDPEPAVPLDLIARVLDDSEHPGAVVQVTTLCVPAPWQQMDPNQFASRSYRELQQLQPTPPLPAERTTWVAVRLEARSRAEVGMAGSYDAEHAPALVASLIRKVGRLLREAGLDHRILTAEELTGAVSRACEFDSASTAGEAWRPTEDWTTWRSGDLSHTAFWLRTWPKIEDASAMLGTLTSLPAASSGASLMLTRDGDGLAVRCLLRVAAAAETLEQTVQAVDQTAIAMQAELVRLDGEHGPAVYACAPTGGGAK
jgi:type VII secretion protein EccE